MLDPLEGLTPDGMIRTGARLDRIPEPFWAVLDTTVERLRASTPPVAVYVYGSVATGVARVPLSDVDLMTIGLAAERAAELSVSVSVEFVDLCRGVEIAAASARDFDGEHDEAYGARVFLHHYCVHLAGPDLDRSTSAYRGDQRAARGFNGDIAQHLAHWRRQLDTDDPARLGRRVARKTLLAVAGMVSVHDGIWTTDRERAARRWQQVCPELSTGLDELLQWSAGELIPTTRELAHALNSTIARIVEQFAADVGLWRT